MLANLFHLALLTAFFIIGVRYLQDSLLLRPELPPTSARRKWARAALTALLLGALDVGATVAVVGVLALSPLLALILVKPLFWVAGALPFVWLFKARFFTALKASAWAVLIAVVGDLLTRAAVLLVGGTLLARPLLMGGALAGLGAVVGLMLFVRRRQGRKLAALANAELSAAEQAQIAEELRRADPATAGHTAAAGPGLPQAYCPSCGGAAPSKARHCPGCGGAMDALELQTARPLELRWLGIFVGGMALLLALVSFTPLIKLLFLEMRFPSGTLVALAGPRAPELPVAVSGGFLGVGAFLLLFVIGGITIGALARRPLPRELAVGGVALGLVAWLIWAARAGGDAGMLLSHPMTLVTLAGQPLLTGPLPIFLLLLNVLAVLAALAAARGGALIAERMTGELTCRRCGHRRPLDPRGPAAARPGPCPACHAPAPRSAVSWRWAAPTSGATVLAFVLVMRLAGPALSFYWLCDFAAPSPACVEASRSYSRERLRLEAPRAFDGHRPGIMLQPWKYVGLLAPLFFLGPLLLAWRKRSPQTAGMVVALNAGGSVLAALTVLGFALGGGAFAGAIQIQLLAALAWSAAGGLGIALGAKLRGGDEFADLQLDPPLTATAAAQQPEPAATVDAVAAPPRPLPPPQQQPPPRPQPQP